MNIINTKDRSANVCASEVGRQTLLLLVSMALVGSIWIVPGAVDVSAQAKKKTELVPRVTDFPHGKHKLECGSCHTFPSANWQKVRNAEQAFPDVTDYPVHQSCLNCHRKDFFRTLKPRICSVCHVNPSPKDGSRFPFPNPREIFDKTPKGKNAVSDFEIFYPHDKHSEIVSRYGFPYDRARRLQGFFLAVGMARAQSQNCGVCHQTYMPQGDSSDEYFTPAPKNLGISFWLKKGTFKTVQIGHTICFGCHSADSGLSPAATDCKTCHSLKQKETPVDFDPLAAKRMGIDDKLTLLAWRKRDSSATFRHEWSSHADLDCVTCHEVNAMNTLERATKKVSIVACAMCHVTQTTADGGALNFEADQRNSNPKFACAKCHIAYGSGPIPVSHEKAISEANE